MYRQWRTAWAYPLVVLLAATLAPGAGPAFAAPPCRDGAIPYNDAELDRLSAGLSGDPRPVSQRILDTAPAVNARVVAFETGICTRTGLAAARTFVAVEGQRLWDTAVTVARSGNLDDRPLYWARLRMVAAIRQWTPAFPLGTADRADLELRLDRAARGMNDDAFGSATRKVFVSGFDPFQLDGDNVRRGNPSAASVLRLDDLRTTIGGQPVEIQAVVFPVRFADFTAGIVEDVFTKPTGAGRATFITTVSQGRFGQFDLEVYNGRNRSAGITDNRDEFGGGDFFNPAKPPDLLDTDPQFTLSSLPVSAMVVGVTPVFVNKSITEIRAGESTPSGRGDGPTILSTAVSGSGGGYLSNEIAYRVTLLRDKGRLAGPIVPAGHVHVPVLPVPDGNTAITDAQFESSRLDIAQQYEAILTAGVTVGAPVPLRLTVNKATYRVGETPVYAVTGPFPFTPIQWSSARGTPLAPTGEDDADYGDVTDANGAWTGAGAAWTAADIGAWVKQVRLDGVIATVSFTVTP